MRYNLSLPKIEKQDYLPLLLILLVAFGLVSKFLIAINNSLNSDTVVPGLEAMEVFRHGNTFLAGFYFPISYPYVFTDFIPFYLLPQALTGYDPLVLDLTGYAIYVLILLVYSGIVLKVSGDRVKALLFAALFGNLSPSAYVIFMQPVSHGATLLFAGVIFLLLLGMEKIRAHGLIAIAAVIFLVSLSDNLFLAILAIPFPLAYLIRRLPRKKSTAVDMLRPALVALVPALAGYGVKLYLPQMVSTDVYFILSNGKQPADLPGLLVQNLASYFSNLAQVTSDGLYSLATGNPGVLEILSISLVIAFIYAAYNVWRDLRKEATDVKYVFFTFLLVSNILLLLGNTLTSLSAARYLTFTSLSILMMLGLGYDRKKAYLLLIMIIILVGAVSSVAYLSKMDYQPNKDEYGLIHYLEENNLTYGYAGYWDSNIITYLSDEKVTVRAIGYNDEGSVPYLFLSDSKWYDNKPKDYFIIYHQYHDQGPIGAYIMQNPADQTFQYGEYYIYKYDSA